MDISTPAKKLRFRGEFNFHSRVDDLDKSNNVKEELDVKKDDTPSFLDFFKVEMARGYMLEHDEERYTARRQKIYSFIRIPRDLERFIVYGIMQCADSFLYIHTFLPVRFALALWGLISRPIFSCLGLRRRNQRLLTPAEICDLLKSTIWITCTLIMLSVDTNRVYHIIKSQSIIKLYIFYNMLEVGDRLLSAFGQDTMDALFWTATEPRKSKHEQTGLFTHVVLALIYVLLHSFLIMFQTTTLNVAVNSNNKALLTIMISNNFVELKGAVFKKFDKNNLFQLTCSDVRERFHLSVLLFIVMIQTMKEFDWSFSQFCVMVPDLFAVLLTEILIDWIKHAFITRFNEIPEQTYREYTTSLAYDMTQTRQKHAFSDHSDLVARRMGFIPFPLGVVLIKAIYSAVAFDNIAAFALFLLAYVFVMGLRILITICALGKACKLMKDHQDEKNGSTPSSMTNVQPINTTSTTELRSAPTNNNTNSSQSSNPSFVMPGITPLQSTPTSSVTTIPRQQQPTYNLGVDTTILSGALPYVIQRSATADEKSFSSPHFINSSNALTASIFNSTTKGILNPTNGIDLDVSNSLKLGGAVILSNSDVELEDVHLNEHLLDTNNINNDFVEVESAHSEPDLSQQQQELDDDDLNSSSTGHNSNSTYSDSSSNQLSDRVRCRLPSKRTHKRSESEPSMQSIVGECDTQLTQQPQ